MASWSTPGSNCRTSARSSGTIIPNGARKPPLLQDAQLDWRKLMNLHNRDCFRAVSAGRQGPDRPLRLGWRQPRRAVFRIARRRRQPRALHAHERRRARASSAAAHGFDPHRALPAPAKTPRPLRLFLDFRAELARRMQEDWIGEIESFRAAQPDLDIVLTHVDDRFDTGMKDAIGADAGARAAAARRRTISRS